MGNPLEQQKNFRSAKKGGNSNSIEKQSFGMAFYLKLEALDALKVKY